MQDLNAASQPHNPSRRPDGQRDPPSWAQANKHRGLRRTLPQTVPHATRAAALSLALPGSRSIRGLKAREESQQVQDLVPGLVHCTEHSTSVCFVP